MAHRYVYLTNLIFTLPKKQQHKITFCCTNAVNMNTGECLIYYWLTTATKEHIKILIIRLSIHKTGFTGLNCVIFTWTQKEPECLYSQDHTRAWCPDQTNSSKSVMRPASSVNHPLLPHSSRQTWDETAGHPRCPFTAQNRSKRRRPGQCQRSDDLRPPASGTVRRPETCTLGLAWRWTADLYCSSYSD